MKPLKPHERLEKVFGTTEGINRLKKRFGLGDIVYKWLRDTEGANATGHPNPIERVRDIIDEAFIHDRSGAGARLIASDALEYYDYLTGSNSDDLNQKEEVNALLMKAADVVCQLNVNDIRKMSKKEQKELAENLSGVCAAVERLKVLLNNGGKSNARLFVTPRQGG